MKIRFFRENLLAWYDPNRRPMPWKEADDPYQIWLSEIILQQTRVEQGRAYFEKFIEAYPMVHDLANAPLDEVLKHWEGLGYYNRARNMHATAKYISKNLKGAFPQAYEVLLTLKGVGPYTAAAIASFAFGTPKAVVDGNVIRVLARFFGISDNPATTAGKKQFNQLARKCLDTSKPGRYNQAIMDFGALQCKPGQPDCHKCPMNKHCFAFRENKVTELPVKPAKKARKKRYFHYALVRAEGDILIQQRKKTDIWKQLYEFPLLEVKEPSQKVSTPEIIPELGDQKIKQRDRSTFYKQTLSHQVIHAQFHEIWLRSKPDNMSRDNRQWIPEEELSQFAFPRVIRLYLNDNALSLNLQ